MRNSSFIHSNSQRIDKLVKKFQGYVIPPSKTKLIKYLGNFSANEVETGLKILEKIDFFNSKRTSNLLKTLFEKLKHFSPVDKMLIFPIDPVLGSSSYRMIEKFRCVNHLKAAKYNSMFPSIVECGLIQSLHEARNKNIIFIDDLIASGTSFVKFYEKIAATFDDSCKYFVGSVTAHKEGAEFIKSVASVIVISATPIIPHHKKILHPGNKCFSNSEREILKKYCRRMGVKKEYTFGYKEMSSPVIFYEKTPNNVLPILYDKRENWTTVFTN